MKNFISLLTWTLVLFFSTKAYADKAYMKYGKITQKEIDMTSCPIDSNASAVILGAVGDTYFSIENDKILMLTQRHIRIKIFDKDALDEGNFTIYLYKSSNGSIEKASNIKGAVYNMKDNKLIKSKLNNSNIFKDEADKNQNVVNIAMPDVKVGSIIELSYMVRSPFYFNLPSWYFQKNIPTLHSEYKVHIIEWYRYKNWVEGYLPISKTEKITHEKFSYRVDSKVVAGQNRIPAYTQDFNANVKHMIYTADSIPAFKNEPYITTPHDYLSSVHFELLSTKYPWSNYINHTTDWANVNKTMMEDENFGITLKNDGHLKEISAHISSLDLSAEEKACMAYNHINKKMIWNGNYRTQANSSIRKAYINSEGNSSDINLNLVALCRKVGLESYPVAVSTRDHGMIRPGLISITQFNHVIAAVKIGNDYLLMDATDIHCPYNLLPPNTLNNKGRLINDKSGEWVDLYSQTPKNEIYMLNMSMDKNFNLSGKLIYQAENYAALQFRKKYNSKDSEESFIHTLENQYNEAHLEDFNVENIDSLHKPVIVKANISLKNRVNQAGNMVFLNPKLINRITENIFKREERTYPVDYNYPIKKKIVISISIPEGYTVDELPQKLAMSMPNNAARYIFSIHSNDRTIRLVNHFEINQTIFSGNEYGSLRKFNQMIVSKEAEQVVITPK